METDKVYPLDELKRQLIRMQYHPVHGTIEAGMFDIHGEMADIYASTDKILYRLHFNDEMLEHIEIRDPLTYQPKGNVDHITLWPATQYMQNLGNLDKILQAIEAEMKERVKRFTKHGQLVEAQRLQKRVMYDIKMIKETGFVNGIENYSPYFENRLSGETPNTLFDYFPDDCLVIIDESHMTIPQLQAMPKGDRSRKETLIDHGFRLPSAIHHRPVNFNELQYKLDRESGDKTGLSSSGNKHDTAKTLFVSATPAQFELDLSTKVVEQIIRPTGLLDPITYVYPKS
ncbi:MAG: hypothetical protein Q8O99_03655 [bacterium]|nr:hypothetical protein [bacterium]